MVNGEWVEDRYGANTSLQLTKGYVRIGDYKDKCLSDPGLCPKGITVSFWALLNSLTTEEGYLLR